MNDNVFETLKERKDKLKSLIEQAASFGWIDSNRKAEMLNKMNSDVLTIGVIGQMKCGKSTFLNSFVFGDTILPAATTPMTAALSVITYGEKERIVAEFYTRDEWAEQKMQAARSLDEADGNAAEESKIKAAKELVAKADKLGGKLDSLLGKTQEDDFGNLIEYVGADGKYISITKSVKIFYPKEYLKGVEVVDTPGFNDPIVSREERTKEFLKKADVVLMMLYAGRPFDATDRDIIFKNVSQCGIGKVLIGINKYDIPFENGESEQEVRDYVIEEIRKACRVGNNDILNEILKETSPIPLSAEMALLSMLPMSKILENETLKFAWNRHCENFEVSTQQGLRQKSHIDDLSQAVKDIVVKEKDRILFSKPINAILAAGGSIKEEIDKKIRDAKQENENLNLPDEELEEKENRLKRGHKKIDRKISSLGEDIGAELRSIIRKGKQTLEDDVDSACNRMRSIVDTEWKLLTNYESKIHPRIDAELTRLATRTLKRSVDNLANNAKRAIDGCIREFFSDTEDILMKFLPDFDSREFINEVQRKIEIDVEEKDLFTVDRTEEDDDFGFLDVLYAFFNGASYGLLGMVGRGFSYNDAKANVLSRINAISSDFDPEPYLEAVLKRKDTIISTVKKAFIDELIQPLQTQLEEIKADKSNKEARIKENEQLLVNLEKRSKEFKEQMDSISSIKASLG